MASQLALSQQLAEKEVQLQEIEHQVSNINLKISKLSQKFFIEANKIQTRINRVQASRPRGNPANHWPHRPITNSFSLLFRSLLE